LSVECDEGDGLTTGCRFRRKSWIRQVPISRSTVSNGRSCRWTSIRSGVLSHPRASTPITRFEYWPTGGSRTRTVSSSRSMTMPKSCACCTCGGVRDNRRWPTNSEAT